MTLEYYLLSKINEIDRRLKEISDLKDRFNKSKGKGNMVISRGVPTVEVLILESKKQAFQELLELVKKGEVK